MKMLLVFTPAPCHCIYYSLCVCVCVLQSMVVMEQDDSQVPSQQTFGLLREIGHEKKQREKKSGESITDEECKCIN